MLCDGPSRTGSELYIAARGMPVDVILSDGEWAKVRRKDGIIADITAIDIWGI